MKKNLIRAAFYTPTENGGWGLPMMLWGEPGVAKSSIFRDIADEEGQPLVVLSPGEKGEGAFGVIPVPRDGRLHYDPPAEYDVLVDGGLLCIDEINLAAPAIQGPIMSILLGKRIGGCQLHKRVRCFGAANPPELSAGGFDLAAPVANRLGHITWDAPSVEEHAAYMLDSIHSTDQERTRAPSSKALNEEDRTMKLWPDAWARAVGLETSYLRTRPGAKNACPKPGDPKRSWPSDRSWTMATRALASSMVVNQLHPKDNDPAHLSETDVEEFVGAFISEPIASEWFTWMRKQDLPNPADLLDGKISYTHNEERLDRAVAVLTSCCALVTPKEATRRLDRAEALWGLMQSIIEARGSEDILVMPGSSLVVRGLWKGANATKVLNKIEPLLRAAGIEMSESAR